MSGTAEDQMWRKETKGRGQLASERSSWGADLLMRGRGTEGGRVVQRSAAKYRHSAGPVEHRHQHQRTAPGHGRGDTLACDHEIALGTAERLDVEQALGFGLGEGGLEVAVEGVLDVVLCEAAVRVVDEGGGHCGAA